jgi:hypothetical protein
MNRCAAASASMSFILSRRCRNHIAWESAAKVRQLVELVNKGFQIAVQEWACYMETIGQSRTWSFPSFFWAEQDKIFMLGITSLAESVPVRTRVFHASSPKLRSGGRDMHSSAPKLGMRLVILSPMKKHRCDDLHERCLGEEPSKAVHLWLAADCDAGGRFRLDVIPPRISH